MTHIRCAPGSTMRGLLFVATVAMVAGVACGQATPSNQNSAEGASRQPAAGNQTGQQATQQAGQQAQGSQSDMDDATGAKFAAAAQGQKGLRVESVLEDSPASTAGLKEGDEVLSADGRPFKQARHLEAYLSAQVGRPVPLIIERNGQQSTVQIVPAPTQSDHAWLGVFLETPPAAAAQSPSQTGQPGQNAQNGQSERGAEIVDMAPNSPAAKAGLQQGDIIVQVNGKEIDDAAELVADIHEMKPQTKVEFTVLRSNKDQKFPVTLGSRNEEYAGGQGESRGPGEFGGQAPGQFSPQQFPGGPNGQFAGSQEFPNQFGPQMMHQLMQQNQRIEQELQDLRNDVKQLRDQLQKK